VPPLLSGTTGLVNYWRLGDAYAPVATDTFTGAAGTVLSSHTGELGATWTRHSGTATLVLSNENRIRKSGTPNGYYWASATPASVDYAVEADVHRKSGVTGDRVGVIGRYDSVNSWYEASHDTTVGWLLRKTADGGRASRPSASRVRR